MGCGGLLLFKVPARKAKQLTEHHLLIFKREVLFHQEKLFFGTDQQKYVPCNTVFSFVVAIIQ